MPLNGGQVLAVLLLQWTVMKPVVRASTQTAAAQVEIEMQAWQDCSERRLPSLSYLGACAEQRPALYESRDGKSHIGALANCAAAFDGNTSTFVEDAVLYTERKVFGKPQPNLEGNRKSTYIGIDLHGHLVHLTGVSITPRAHNTDWMPRKHPYSPEQTLSNWTEALAGARVQGSRNLVNWTDLYTFPAGLAPNPTTTTITFEAMTTGSCEPFSAFRFVQSSEHKRVYFANSAIGPVGMYRESKHPHPHARFVLSKRCLERERGLRTRLCWRRSEGAARCKLLRHRCCPSSTTSTTTTTTTTTTTSSSSSSSSAL